MEERWSDQRAGKWGGLTAGVVATIRQIGDNTGYMMLKSASERHASNERTDEWPMRDNLLELAGRYDLESDW